MITDKKVRAAVAVIAAQLEAGLGECLDCNTVGFQIVIHIPPKQNRRSVRVEFPPKQITAVADLTE